MTGPRQQIDPDLDPDLELDTKLSRDAQRLLAGRVLQQAVADAKWRIGVVLSLLAVAATILGVEAKDAVGDLRTRSTELATAADSLRTRSDSLDRLIERSKAALGETVRSYDTRLESLTQRNHTQMVSAELERLRVREIGDSLTRRAGRTQTALESMRDEVNASLASSSALTSRFENERNEFERRMRDTLADVSRRTQDVQASVTRISERAFDTGFFPVLEEQVYTFPDSGWQLAIRFENADLDELQNVCVYTGTRPAVDMRSCSPGRSPGFQAIAVLPKDGAVVVADGRWEYEIELHNILKIGASRSDIAVFHVERRARAAGAATRQE